MSKKDCTSRLVWYTLAVVVAMVGIGLVPEFELFGMRFAKVDIFSELRAADGDVVEYQADIERLEQELATLTTPDKLVVAD
jgi:hypothetical protein